MDMQAVERALSGLREGYQADGYDLHVEDISGGVAKIRISAGLDACAECLVPKAIAVNIIKASLEEFSAIKEVELIYPVDQ